jgi:molybdopterin-guanine dinucleotide biosynthesis protein B
MHHRKTCACLEAYLAIILGWRDCDGISRTRVLHTVRTDSAIGCCMKCLGFVGWSGVGKTTLIEQMVREIVAKGLSVSLIKHTHHDFDLDREGKDSYRYRLRGRLRLCYRAHSAGALMREHRDAPPDSLPELLARLTPCNFVLVEGFKTADIPKIEVFRPSLGKPLLHPECASIVAIASDEPVSADVPVLPLNESDRIAAFVLQFFHVI